MADEKFRLPGSSYPELTKIIKAYAHVKPDSSVEDVAKLAVMNRPTVSANTVFLTAVGIITFGHKKNITPQGKALAQALEHEMPEEIMSKWREVIERHDYFQKLVAAVRIRNGMDLNTLMTHAAYTAGQGNTPQAKTGARAVVDILKAAGLLVDRDGRLVVGTPPDASAAPFIPEQPPVTTVQQGSASVSSVPANTATAGLLTPGVALTINVEVKVACAASEVEQLGQALRKMLTELTSPPGDPAPAENGDDTPKDA